MKPAPTLIDEVYRTSFRNETNPGWKSNSEMRRAFEKARRFIVDTPMSTFMAELANESFIKTRGKEVSTRIADSLRVQARLPHESIWIEYDIRAYQVRANEMLGTTMPPAWELPWREGWLIQQHPQIDTAMILHLFTQGAPDEPRGEDGFDLWTFPFAYAWCADDSPLPWRTSVFGQKAHASSFIVGLGGYEQHNVGCVRSPLIDDAEASTPTRMEAYRSLFREWQGILRRVWALLATIDNIPMVRGEVRQSKGFLGKGRIRKFLDHTTITLRVPAKTQTRVLARKLIAIAHRKRHEVRAFWRDDWRHPLGKCNPHLWEARDDSADHIECSICHGRQTYIHKHERGDAGLGYVTHDYQVVHGGNAA